MSTQNKSKLILDDLKQLDETILLNYQQRSPMVNGNVEWICFLFFTACCVDFDVYNVNLGTCNLCSPGQIQFTLILFPIKSAAIALVSPITAALVAPYTQRLGAPATVKPLVTCILYVRRTSIMHDSNI